MFERDGDMVEVKQFRVWGLGFRVNEFLKAMETWSR